MISSVSIHIHEVFADDAGVAGVCAASVRWFRRAGIAAHTDPGRIHNFHFAVLVMIVGLGMLSAQEPHNLIFHNALHAKPLGGIATLDAPDIGQFIANHEADRFVGR
jgi:hypothetical protein